MVNGIGQFSISRFLKLQLEICITKLFHNGGCPGNFRRKRVLFPHCIEGAGLLLCRIDYRVTRLINCFSIL